MAEMNDRGQMILMAGVLLAIIFVALALLVNAAIYTDNVATRGGDSASEALEYQNGVTGSVGELIDAENADGEHANVNEIETAVEAGTDKIDETHKGYHLRRGAGTTTSLDTATFEEGRYLSETSTTRFTDWTANASAVRGFVIDLDTTNMTEGSAFEIDLNGTRLSVNRTGGNIEVSGGTEGIECAVPKSDMVRLDVTGQQLGGEPCRFGFPDLDDDSQIGIENGEHAAGTYELTVKHGNHFDDDIPTEIVSEAVYSVDLDLRIDTPELSYERTVRIAPGEPDV